MSKKHYKQPNKKSLGKTLLTVLLSILGVVAVALDIWCGYIHFFGKEKAVSNTVNISDMKVEYKDATGETVTETKTFLEVNAFDNAVEIKFNMLMDESETRFYSQGIQLIVKDGLEKTISSSDIFKGHYTSELASQRTELNLDDNWLVNHFGYRHDIVWNDKVYNYIDVFNYQSADDYQTPLSGGTLFEDDKMFKIQVKKGDETKIMGMRFRCYDEKRVSGVNAILSMLDGNKGMMIDTANMVKVADSYSQRLEETWIFKNSVRHDYYYYYRAFDMDYLMEYITNSVAGLAHGFVGETYLELPDVFKLYEYNEEKGSYGAVNGEQKNEIVKLDTSTFLFSKIKLTVNDGNLVSSTQSMFNRIRNYQNYTTDENYIDKTDYLTGRSLITATLDNLDWIETETAGVYTFALSEDFKKKWSKFKYSAFIKVVIDSEYLEECGITYQNFDLTSADDFTIYNIKTTAGDTLYEGVQYA